MRASLQSTSGANYGRWVSSRDWLAFILSRPFTDEPGGQMIYSIGNSHIPGVILVRTSGRTLCDVTPAWPPVVSLAIEPIAGAILACQPG